MRLFELANRASRPRVRTVFNHKLTALRERSDLRDLKKTKANLVWRKTGNVIEIRTKASLTEGESRNVELVFSRTEILLMASQFLSSMPDDRLLDLMRNIAKES